MKNSFTNSISVIISNVYTIALYNQKDMYLVHHNFQTAKVIFFYNRLLFF